MLDKVEYGSVGEEVPPTGTDGDIKLLDVLGPISWTELLIAVEVVVRSTVLD